MYSLELKRILSKKSILFMVFLFLPLFILTCFVPGITKPEAKPADITTAELAAESRFLALPSAFEGLADITNDYKQDLREKWIAFGGFSKTGEGGNDAYGLYWNFYHAEAIERDEISEAYAALQPVFDTFYNAYKQYLCDTPLLFVKGKDYRAFIKGVEELHIYFTSNETDPHVLNTWRGRCNEIRRDTNFREIIENMQNMRLTPAQSQDLKQKFAIVNEKRLQFTQNTSEETIIYIDFCDTAYNYLVSHMNNYVVKNAYFKTRIYHGFGATSKKQAELKRFEYMLENNKTDMYYSHPLAFNSVMHSSTGSTMFDFAYNGFFIIAIALVLLAIIITVFCVFDDIKRKTVVGAIVSPNSRRKIIMSKLLACYTAILIVVALLCAAYLITGTIIVGSASAPPVLFVMFGKVITMSPFMYFLMVMAMLILMLCFFMTLTAALCLKVRSKGALIILASFLCIGLTIANFFCLTYAIYQIIIVPVFICAFIACLGTAVGGFRKKDF